MVVISNVANFIQKFKMIRQLQREIIWQIQTSRSLLLPPFIHRFHLAAPNGIIFTDDVFFYDDPFFRLGHFHETNGKLLIEMSPFSIWTFPSAYGTCNLKQMTTFVNPFVGKYSKFPKAMHTSFPTYQTPMSERFLEATALQNLLLEKRVVDLLDSIRNGVFIINTEGKIMACNKTGRELLGKTKLASFLHQTKGK